MKSYLISDNRDTFVGLQLAGINGKIIQNREDALKEMKMVIQNDDIGILILTEKIVDMISEEVMEYKIKSKTPLIIEIPDRHGSIRESNVIEEYIRNSLGIRI
ncbi:MAG: V-type ATP synthase subunit F [Tissierellia bacterium]|nr:V-type ATP synthase subunit F [Tissierellia bacterium]MDD4436623.1 V-type ATP synthase subunit F [Tissierellia bacterium]